MRELWLEVLVFTSASNLGNVTPSCLEITKSALMYRTQQELTVVVPELVP